MSSLVKKAVKKALKAAGITKKEEKSLHVHHHHHYHDRDKDESNDPKPKKIAKKCPKCDGKGSVSKWHDPPYGGPGYWTSACSQCDGKKYIVVYDFD